MIVLLRLIILVLTYCVFCILNLNFVKFEFVRFFSYIIIEGILIVYVCVGCMYIFFGI